MREHSKPVKPKHMGHVGEDHIRAWANRFGIRADSFRYKRLATEVDGIPYVVEAAFAIFNDQADGHSLSLV